MLVHGLGRICARFDEKKSDIDRIEWYISLTAIGLSRGNHSVLIDRLIGDDSRTLLKTKIDFFVCPPRNQGLEILVVVVVVVVVAREIARST